MYEKCILFFRAGKYAIPTHTRIANTHEFHKIIYVGRRNVSALRFVYIYMHVRCPRVTIKRTIFHLTNRKKNLLFVRNRDLSQFI